MGQVEIESIYLHASYFEDQTKPTSEEIEFLADDIRESLKLRKDTRWQEIDKETRMHLWKIVSGQESNDPSIVARASAAKEIIILANSGLIKKAFNLWHSGEQENFWDYFQIGQIALLKAVEKYVPGKGEFSTYAMYLIRGEMAREQSGNWLGFPHRLIDRIRTVSRLELLLGKGSRIPTDEELSVELKTKTEQVAYVKRMRSRRVVFGEEVLRQKENHVDHWLEFLNSDQKSRPVEEEVIEKEEKRFYSEKFWELVNNPGVVEAKEAEALILLFGGLRGKIYSRNEAGEIMGLTPERVRQLGKSGLGKIYQEFKRRNYPVGKLSLKV